MNKIIGRISNKDIKETAHIYNQFEIVILW